MVVGGDANEGAVSVKRHQPRNRQVGIARELIPGDDGTGRNVGTAFPFEEARYRQLINQGAEETTRCGNGLSIAASRDACIRSIVLLSPRADRSSELSRLPTIGIAPAVGSPCDLGKMQRRAAVELRETTGNFIFQPDRLRNGDEFAG